VRTVQADGAWPEGPGLLDQADGVVLYLGAGARWMESDADRLQAFRRLASRGGGIVALHWSIGTKEAEYIDPARSLLGGIHGGPDRKYIVTEGDLKVVDRQHPITRGVDNLTLYDEFYYRLKFAEAGTVTPLVQVTLEERPETIAWAYERPDGGRSFGFSAMHFHRHWDVESLRRLIAQSVLWTVDLPIPDEGLDVSVSAEALKLEQ
jgi:hypothetical protein